MLKDSARIAAAFATLVVPATAGDVQIRVGNVGSQGGSIAVAVCTEAEFLGNCRIAATAPARPGNVVVRLRDVPPGIYAAQAYHDLDGDGRLGTNLIGYPTEPFGFSRGATARFGPPRFSDAAIRVGQGGESVDVRLGSER